MGKIFERELKGILSANDDVLARVTKTCSPEEKSGYLRIRENPFMVIRAAGSLGVDLVAIRDGMSFPIEVKSSTADVLRFSRSEKLLIQAEEMIKDCRRVNLVPLYAYRYKGRRGDAWKIFTLEMGELDMNTYSGIPKLIYGQLPRVRPSKDGNFIMRWKDGWPLSKFIDYTITLAGRRCQTVRSLASAEVEVRTDTSTLADAPLRILDAYPSQSP
jgi:Holliday junction resolvase